MNNYTFMGYSVITESSLGYDDLLVIQGVLLILTTPKRSIPMRPNFGTDLKYLLFEPLGSVDDNYLNELSKTYVVDALKYERRATVVSTSTTFDHKSSTITLKIQIRINLSGAIASIIYPLSDAPIKETK